MFGWDIFLQFCWTWWKTWSIANTFSSPARSNRLQIESKTMMSWRGNDFKVSFTLSPFFESNTSMIPVMEMMHFSLISLMLWSSFTVLSSFEKADFIMSNTTLISPDDYEILRQSKSRALSSIILKKISFTACLRGLVLSGEIEITHLWNKEFCFSCTID